MAFRIVEEKCIGCGACKWVCLFDVPALAEDGVKLTLTVSESPTVMVLVLKSKLIPAAGTRLVAGSTYCVQYEGRLALQRLDQPGGQYPIHVPGADAGEGHRAEGLLGTCDDL